MGRHSEGAGVVGRGLHGHENLYPSISADPLKTTHSYPDRATEYPGKHLTKTCNGPRSDISTIFFFFFISSDILSFLNDYPSIRPATASGPQIPDQSSATCSSARFDIPEEADLYPSTYVADFPLQTLNGWAALSSKIRLLWLMLGALEVSPFEGK